MNRWILRHSVIAAPLIWVCSFWTWMYGLGNTVTFFGWEFPLIPEASTSQHLMFGLPLMITGLLGLSVANRLQKLNKHRSDLGDPWNRQRRAWAIWERAERNKFEETHSQGH